MNTIQKGLASAMLLLIGSSAQASDEDRSGLFLGFGFGSSSIATSVESTEGVSGTAFATEDRGGAFSLRIGGSVGNKGAVYFLSQAAATEAELGHSLTGIGATYYFRKSGASLYLTGGYGYGLVSYADKDVAEGTGRAAMAGVGLELGWGLNLELNHMRINTTPDTTEQNPGTGVNYDIDSTQFMIGYNWF